MALVRVSGYEYKGRLKTPLLKYKIQLRTLILKLKPPRFNRNLHGRNYIRGRSLLKLPQTRDIVLGEYASIFYTEAYSIITKANTLLDTKKQAKQLYSFHHSLGLSSNTRKTLLNTLVYQLNNQIIFHCLVNLKVL